MKQKIKITRDALESAMDELLQSRFRNYLYTHKSSAIGHEPIIQRFPDSIEVEVDVQGQEDDPFPKIKHALDRLDLGDVHDRITSLEKRVEKYSNATTWDQHSKEVNADMDALAHVLAAKHNHRITQLEKRVDKLEGK